MVNSKRKKLNKNLCSLLLCIGLLLSSLLGFNLKFEEKQVSAISSNVVEVISDTDTSKKNYYNFYTTSSSKPATPNGWTAVDSKNVTNADNIKRGIVDITDETTFSYETYETTRPTNVPENIADQAFYKCLMINSYNGAGKYGYRTSNSISLAENSYYTISVTLYTHRTEKTDKTEETDPRASIYLTGVDDSSDVTKFENINTLGSWQTYTFHIATSNNKTANLELWLGSKDSIVQGAVFFREVVITRYSEDYYLSLYNDLEDTDNNNFNLIYQKSELISPVDNGGFENISPLNWTKLPNSINTADQQICKVVDANSFSKINDSLSISPAGTNCSYNNQFALFMYNKEDGYQGVESSEFTIKQHQYYKLSFWAKSDCNIGNGATVKLVDKSEEDAITSAEITLDTTFTAGNNKFRNDWKQYSFYIYGPKVGSKTATIQIWLGTEESQTSGYVFIDDFTIENISYSTFSANTTGIFNFNKDAKNYVIENSFFDITNNEDTKAKYPLAPAGWTKSGSTNVNTFSGVINTNTDHFNANKKYYYKYGIEPTSPDKLDYMEENNNNVLMLGSCAETNSQTYSSSAITLDANAYYKVSFYVNTKYTKNVNEDYYGARVNLKTSTITIFDILNIKYDDDQWHKHEIYIKTGQNSLSANLNLIFENLNGYVFFDDVKVETSTEIDYTNFGYHQYSNIEYKRVDLSVENFDNRTFGNINKNQVPANWTGSEVNNKKVFDNTGIINANNTIFSEISAPTSGNDNILYIGSVRDVYYKFTSNESYSLTAGTYYKITVNILTRNLSQEEENKTDTFGAKIGLTASNEVLLKDINTNGEWKTYTLYVCLESDLSTEIILSLGNTEELVSGEVLFDNFKIQTIDSATYESEIETMDENLYASFINHSDSTEEEEKESEPWTSNFDWVMVPSIITALAIILAVVCTLLRKFNIKRKPRIKTDYDRRKTLDKDIDRREKIALRQQIIEELNQELSAIDNEINEYNILMEQQLQIIRDKIFKEQEEIKRKKIEIEIKKKEATAEREKQLKDNPELVSDKKAEKSYINFITKLDKEEMSLQKELNAKDMKLSHLTESDNAKLNRFFERKEYIKNEIAKIEAEIEEIAKEEEKMWAEYKAAKADAKKRKAEYKAQVKAEKQAKATTKKKSSTPTPAKKPSTKSTSNKSVKQEAEKKED